MSQSNEGPFPRPNVQTRPVAPPEAAELTPAVHAITGRPLLTYPHSIHRAVCAKCKHVWWTPRPMRCPECGSGEVHRTSAVGYLMLALKASPQATTWMLRGNTLLPPSQIFWSPKSTGRLR